MESKVLENKVINSYGIKETGNNNNNNNSHNNTNSYDNYNNSYYRCHGLTSRVVQRFRAKEQLPNTPATVRHYIYFS